MRVLYVAPILSASGGLERTLADKTRWLCEQGHEAMLLTYAQGTDKFFYELDARVRHCDLQCPLFVVYKHPVYQRPWAYVQCRRRFRERFRRVLADFRPDTVVITIPNTEDYIHDMMAVTRQQGVRVVVESHLAADFHLMERPLTERLLYRLFPARRAIRQADLVIALTEHDARHWRSVAREVRVIPNPLSPSFMQATTEQPSEQGGAGSAHRMIAVGRLFRQKRFDRLIDAFARLAPEYPDWTLDIFGEGPLRASLQQQIDRLRLTSRIRLLPPTHRISEEYRRSHLFVLSSDFEGFGLVIIEAMACGLPVVATDCPCGPSEIVKDGVTGLLARLDAADLSDKLRRLLSADAERQAMGRNAHDEALLRYRFDRLMPQWLEAYRGNFVKQQ